jgi:hypothetical protein
MALTTSSFSATSASIIACSCALSGSLSMRASQGGPSDLPAPRRYGKRTTKPLCTKKRAITPSVPTIGSRSLPWL